MDVLVEFLFGPTPGLLALSGMQIELSGMIGREVDLRTPLELSRYFREEVMREARLLHAAWPGGEPLRRPHPRTAHLEAA